MNEKERLFVLAYRLAEARLRKSGSVFSEKKYWKISRITTGQRYRVASGANVRKRIGYIRGHYMIKYLLAFLLLTTTAQAEVKVIYQNKCNVFSGWDCFNETQGATVQETLSQVLLAVKNTKYKKNLVVYSIDPKRPKANEWEYGAWFKRGRIYFSAMPGCPNARWDLERLLRRMR